MSGALVETFESVRFDRMGGPEVLRLETVAAQAPGRGEVFIRVLAIGVTQGDAMYREGTYLEQPRFPSGLGTEACGQIVAVGRDVGDWLVGDRISVHSSHSINNYPVYGAYATVPVTSIVATPKGMTDEEGAAFTLAYIPMYLALVREARLAVGETVLLNAAGATTSLAACQIARMAGARVIGLVRSAEKARLLADAGYDALFVFDDDVVTRVREFSVGGVDIVLDPVVGPQSQKLGEMCRMRGRIVHYGALETPIAQHSIYELVTKFLMVTGFTIYGYTGSVPLGIPRNDAAIAEAMRFIDRGVTTGQLKPVIAARYPLDAVVDAHEALKAGRHVGKLLLVPQQTVT